MHAFNFTLAAFLTCRTLFRYNISFVRILLLCVSLMRAMQLIITHNIGGGPENEVVLITLCIKSLHP